MTPAPSSHGGHGGQLPLRPVVDVYCDGTWVEGTELGEDLRLERPATLDPAIGYRGCRQRLARAQDVPLRPYRATPGDVGALCHDRARRRDGSPRGNGTYADRREQVVRRITDGKTAPGS